MGNIVVCGDSYSVGIGCHDLLTEPYGSLLSKELDKTLINFAKGSSTNFSIYLQVKHVIHHVKDVDLVIVSPTSYNRVQWYVENSESVDKTDLTNSMINYHQYPPYQEGSYPHIIKNPMENDPNYTGKILTENYYGIISYVDDVLDKKFQKGKYYEKFKSEPDRKFRIMKDYYLNIFDDSIQRSYDVGMITMAHLLLKSYGLKHLILTDEPEYQHFVPKNHMVNICWGELSDRFPDDLKTLHTSYEGHIYVFNEIMKKINENNL